MSNNRRCPVCLANGRDNGGDNGHMFLMENGKKWMCNRVEHHPDGMFFFLPNDPETNEPIQDEAKDEYPEVPADTGFSDTTSKTPEDALSAIFGPSNVTPTGRVQSISQPTKEVVVEDFRGVPKDVWEHYGVTFEKTDGELTKQFYPVTLKLKPRTAKVRMIEDKEFYWEDSKKAKKKDLFGMTTTAGKVPKRVLITEGEIDAASAYHMLSKYKVCCLSGMDGDSIKNIVNNVEFLEKIEILTFCPDNDPAGNDFCEKFVSMFPNAMVMQYSEKDANQMLMVGKEKEFVDAYFRAEKYRPPSICEVSTFSNSLDTFVPVGISYPWPDLDAITYGINPHTVLSIGSGPGAGKSTLVRGIQEHLMFHHKLPIGIFSLEEAKELTLRLLVGYQMNQRLHIPGSIYDIAVAKEHAANLEGRAFIYDKRFFNGKWDKIEKSIRFMYAMGICHFFIDPITALVVHLDPSTQNTALGVIMSDLSTLMQELPIYVMIVNHLNNPTSGPTHDEGGRVLPSQFTGSKAQWRFSTDMLGLERNILSEEEDIKNTMIVRNLKHRTDGDLTGRTARLTYDVPSGRLKQGDSGFKSVNPSLTQDKAGGNDTNVARKVPESNVASTMDTKEFSQRTSAPAKTLEDIFGGG